jgi:hypothetical protein
MYIYVVALHPGFAKLASFLVKTHIEFVSEYDVAFKKYALTKIFVSPNSRPKHVFVCVWNR